MPKANVTNEQIVAGYLEVYAAKGTLTDLANKLGMKYNNLYARVEGLKNPKPSPKTGITRKAVNLPDLVAGQRGVSTKVDSLNAMIEAALAGDKKEEIAPPADVVA
jgi:hypothetical protein